MVEEVIVFVHGAVIENGIEGRFHLVFQSKAVPAEVAVLKVEDARVETAEDIGRVVLRIRAADGALKVGREVVPVQAVGGLGQARTISATSW